jgi:hypothetical protein
MHTTTMATAVASLIPCYNNTPQVTAVSYYWQQQGTPALCIRAVFAAEHCVYMSTLCSSNRCSIRSEMQDITLYHAVDVKQHFYAQAKT